MNVTMVEAGEDSVRLQIEVEPERVKQAVQSAYRKLASRYTIPGFRKGKTPRPVLERYIGRDALYREALDELVPSCYEQAVAEKGLRPMEQATVDEIELNEEQPVTIVATVAVKPPVTLANYRDVRVPKTPVEVSEADVDQALQEIREERAQLVPGEVVGAASRLVVNAKVTMPNGEVEEDEAVVLDLRQPGAAPEVVEGLQGAKVGETREIAFQVPEGQEHSGQQLKGQFTVETIHEWQLPELDDEFVRELGGKGTLKELRDDLANVIRTRRSEEAEQRRREQILDQIVAVSTVKAPKLLVERRLDVRIAEFFRQLEEAGVPREEYERQSGKTEAMLREEWRAEAEQDIKRQLVLEAIGEAEKIEVLQGELTNAALALYQETQRKTPFKEGEILALRDFIFQQKVFRFLADLGNPEKEPTAGEAATGEEREAQ